MASKDKLAAAFRRVESRLSEAEMARSTEDAAKLSQKIWEAGADLEYITFMLRLSLEDTDDSWQKKSMAPKVSDFEKEISEVRRLLKEACSAWRTNPKEAYVKAGLARGVILRVEGVLLKSAGRDN